MRLRHTARRSGFTLVELIVAAGLTVLIMAVLATGFQVGLQSLSTLKSAGDLADRLRTTETMLRLDLDAPHFDTGSNPGSLPLSELGIGVAPAGGFFQIRQGGASVLEGIDQDSLSSTRVVTSAIPVAVTASTTHSLSMTVRRTGKTPGDLFAAVDGGVGTILAQPANQMDVAVTGSTYVTDWAEVHWFLDTSRPVVQNGVTTFPLCRRVRLLTKSPPPLPPAPPGSSLAEVVSADPAGNTNTLATIANPANRLVPAAFTALANPVRFGDDIVITNVVSFEVKPTWQPVVGGPAPRTNFAPSAPSVLNADFPFDDLSPGNGVNTVFDTFLGGFAPAITSPANQVTPVRITGVQIKIRVYDAKNKLTRQAVVTSKL